jgi:RimJ/RimL family protein N-acetyltransferase
MRITAVTESDLPELLPLVRAYCDFYDSHPTDDDLLEISRALIGDPDGEGVQFLARADGGEAIGFATLFWTWETNTGGWIGVMNDLFVTASWRGRGAAEALIGACRDRCSERGARRLTWQTAPDNFRAQAVYERVGAVRAQWLDYSMSLEGGP